MIFSNYFSEQKGVKETYDYDNTVLKVHLNWKLLFRNFNF